MKVCIIGDVTQANFEKFLAEAFEELGWETILIETGKELKLFYSKKMSGYLLGALFIKNYFDQPYLKKLNEDFYKRIIREKPDLIVAHNNAKLDMDTILKVREELKIPFVSIAADDPTLSYIQVNFLQSIIGFSHLIALDSSIAPRVKYYSNVKSKYITGGTNINSYFPLTENKNVSKNIYKSNLSYCSSSYGGNGLGVYRGAILSNLVEFDLKIFGDKHWARIAKKFPELTPCINSSGFLNSEEVNYLYNNTKIYISIVNPLLLNGVAQRVLDCAAAKCFQIAEWKKDIETSFTENEIETFKSIPELKEKIKWYLDHEKDRNEMVNKAYNKVVKNYKWSDFVRELLSFVFNI